MVSRDQLQEAIAQFTDQRARFGAATETILAVLRERLAALPSEPTAATKPPQPAGEQRKQVTVLFAAIDGFTRLAGAIHNTERLRQIDLLWRQLDETIYAHGGIVDKHMGDVVMGIFGVPTARENDPERAVRCAIAMRELAGEALAALGGKGVSDKGRELVIRIGINTGPVSLGQVGSDDGQTAIGDAVNVASRLKETADEAGVYISQATYRLVHRLFRVETLGPVAIKGRQMPVTAHRVVGSRPRAFFPESDGLEGVAVPMIGRDAELTLLLRALRDTIETGQGRLITIVGEAGVGKSRLVREFSRRLEGLPVKMALFQGRTDQRLMEVPYGLLRDLVVDHFHIEEGDRGRQIEDKLARRLAEVLGRSRGARRRTSEGGAGRSGAAERARQIAHLVGLEMAAPDADLPAPQRAAARERAVETLLAYFVAVARRSAATLFILEDVHWADDDSLALLEQLSALTADAPLMMICLARPLLFERRPVWAAESATPATLPLAPLSENHSRELVLQILRKLPDIPAALLDLIVQSAAGNPFYVEELVRVLIEDGVIVPGETAWQLRRRELTHLRVPATLTGVLQARLDRLPELERLTLQQAAVVGDEFWDSAVQQINSAARNPFDGEQVAAALQSLERRDMIYRVPSPVFNGSQAYLFKHAVLREVAYESVLLRDRPGYHLQAARWLEAQSGERLADYAAPIAQHHERAGLPAEAARLYDLAARRAAEQYKPALAIDYYRKALGLLENLPQFLDLRLNVQEQMGRVLRRQGRLVEALYTYHAMQRLAELDGNLQGEARAENALAGVFADLNDFNAALAAASRAERLARLTGADIEWARALLWRAEAAGQLGHADEARAAATEAADRARALDAPRELARALALLLALAEPAQAATIAAELAALADALEARGASEDAAAALTLLGEAHLRQGDATAALGALERALAARRALGAPGNAADTLRLLGLAVCRAGQVEAAVDYLEEAGALAETAGQRYLRLLCRLALAEALLAHGRAEAAEATLRGVIAAAEDGQRLGTWRHLPEAYDLLALVLQRQGRGDEAVWRTARR
ncbi:MAG TPA: adenylate/guanylate cyclase domain-containing protein [Promineifilum sp.]|nr:adenylate/guanylate cyclase domain-containing protein [Promineifilum sp.]